MMGGVLEPEVDADGGDVKVVKVIVGKALEEGGFAHCCGPHQHYLHDVVVLPLQLHDCKLPQQIILFTVVCLPIFAPILSASLLR